MPNQEMKCEICGAVENGTDKIAWFIYDFGDGVHCECAECHAEYMKEGKDGHKS
jgi:hypothetical protein